MKKFLMYVGMYCMLMAVVSISAVQAKEPEPLTLEQAIIAALENNISLNLARTQIFSALTQVDKEKADAYPDLTFKADAITNHNKSPILGDPLKYNDPITGDDVVLYKNDKKDAQSIGANLIMTVNVFNGSRDKLSLNRAKIELDAVKNNFSHSRQSIIFETISRFVNVVLNQELIKVEKRNLELNQQQERRINSFYKTGNRPINDLYQQRAKTSQAELKVLSAKHNLEVSLLLLSQIMGDLGKTEYKVTTPNPSLLKKNTNTPITEQILSYALKNRQDISAIEKNIMALKKKIAEAKAGYLPQITMSAQAGTNYKNLIDDDNFFEQFADNNPYVSMGLTMTLPIFDKRRTSTQLAQARIQYNGEKLKLAELKQQVDLEVRKSILDYNTSVLQLDVAKKQLKFARKAYETSKERYEIGSSDLVSLTQSMDQLAQASYEEAKSKYNYLLTNLGISYYSGELELRLTEWQSSLRKKFYEEKMKQEHYHKTNNG